MKPTTWVYLSSLIMIAVYFKFRRFWSVRNLDLVALRLSGPGLLLVPKAGNPRPAGSVDRWATSDFRRGGLLPRPPAGRLADGPRPLLGAEPLGQRSGLRRRRMLVFLISQRRHPQTTRPARGGRWADNGLSRQDSPEVQKYLTGTGPAIRCSISSPRIRIQTGHQDSRRKPSAGP